MRVLMVNRSDAYTVFGGDTLQMIKTAEALGRVGVSVDMVLASELDKCKWRYDRVHLFNIQTAEESLRVVREVKSRGLPLVLSTIYWDPLPGWFRDACERSTPWHKLARLVGRRPAYGIYQSWQRFRYPIARVWQQQRELLQSADWLLPNSLAELRQLIADFRLPSETECRASVVVNGVDRALYQEKPIASAEWRQAIGSQGFVLEVGRISPEKNTLGLIQALWDVDIPLVFAGKPSPYSPEYTQACVEIGHRRGQVYFLDFVPNSELPGLYALAGVHALPSWRETPGLVSLEAAAAGCRVVSTEVGSAREYFGEKAWYCNPASKESVKVAVQNALRAPGTDELRELVLRRYTWDAAAQATLDAYMKVSEA